MSLDQAMTTISFASVCVTIDYLNIFSTSLP